MRLQRLRVEQFRQFRQGVEIDDFTPGLNIFSGPNESGKSTLVCALRAAFFEKCRSSSVDDFQPWGDSSAAPQVELDFAHDEQVWRLTKRFLQRKRCDLNVDNETFSGDDAEEKLAQLLGFQLPSRGASKAEHWGIPGLLWIEQGQGQEVRESAQFAGEHLKTALAATLGEITSSGGDEVIAKVEAQRDLLLTKTGKLKGEHNDALQKREALKATLHELDEKIDSYRSRVDRLGDLRRQHALDEAQRPWSNLREQQQEAQTQYDQVEKLGQQQAIDHRMLDDCQRNIRLVSDQLHAFQQQADEVQERQQACQRAQQHFDQLQAQQAQIHENAQRAKVRYHAARDLERKSRQQDQRRTLTRECEHLVETERKLQDDLDKAREIQVELLATQQEQATCRIDRSAVNELKKLSDELRDLRVRQQSIATHLKFAFEPGQDIYLNGAKLTDQGEQLLLEQAELDIVGVGRVQIIPGGEDLGGLARRLDQQQERFEAALRRTEVASLADAEQRAERFARLEVGCENLQRLLRSLAPQGVEDLAGRLALLQRKIETLRDSLAALPEMDERDIPPTQQAEQQLDVADQALKAVEVAQQEYQREIATAEQQIKSAKDEFNRAAALLADPLQAQRKQDNGQRLLEMRAQEDDLKAKVEATQQRIDAARPDILKQDIQRFAASADQAESAFRTRKEELTRLEAELTTLGAQGLEEERAKCVAELQSATRRYDELRRRAEALNLLLDLLREKRQVLTRRLQAPLQQHLNHYLQLLFPQASLEVDEHLIPGQLTRTGSHGPEVADFSALSFGAREQTGLISRLAYADLLQQAGKPTLLILDDALVHCDQRRLVQMKRVLFDAAQRHQVLLFTCHPEQWTDMGVPVRELTSFLVPIQK